MSYPSKIVIFVVLLIIGIFALSSYSKHQLELTSERLENHLNIIENELQSNNWVTVDQQISDIRQNWDKTKTLWAMLLDHIEIDNIDVSLSRLERFIQSKEMAFSLAECAVLKQYVKHIPEKEIFNLENIF